MRTSLRKAATATGATATFALALAACSAGTAPRAGMGPDMPMMGSVAGYHYSSLTCAAPTNLPGSRVNVMLGDMGMMHMAGPSAPPGAHMMLRAYPPTVRAGQVSFVARNMGWRTHEVVIMPLSAGRYPGQRVPGPGGKVDEKGSLGEASSSCAAGSGEGIAAGTVSWLTVTLAPGSYELLCNLPNHYVSGMWQGFTVVP